MDYGERLDDLIKQFAGETSGLLKRVHNVESEVEYIEDHISALRKALTVYEKSIDESQRKINSVAKFFEDFKVAMSYLTEEMNAVSTAQHSQAESLKAIDSLGDVNKNSVRVFHAMTELIVKMDKSAAALDGIGKSIADKHLLSYSKLEEVRSKQGQLEQQNSSVQRLISEGASKSEQSIAEIGKGYFAIASQLSAMKASMDETAKYVQGIEEKCNGIQAFHDQLSARLDSIAGEVEISKAKATEYNSQTQEALGKILSKIEDMETLMNAKKKGLFGK